MARYYFHVSDSTGRLRDEEGRELANLAAAHRVAIEGARSLISADVMQGKLSLDGVISVVDEASSAVLELTYRAAVGLPEL